MRLRLHTYLLLTLGFTAVVPILLFGGFRAQRLQTWTVAQSERETALAAESLAREVGQLMQAHTDAVEALAAAVGAATYDPPTVQRITTAQHRAADTLSTMWVADARGSPISASPALDSSGRPSVGLDSSGSDDRRVWSTTSITYSRAELGRTTQRPTLQIAVPITDSSGAFIGLAAGALDLAEIQALAETVISRTPGLRPVVLDSEGRVLAHPNEAARSSLRDLSTVELYRPSNSGTTEIRIQPDEDGLTMRAAVVGVPVGALNWTVLVSRSEAEVQAHVGQAQRDTLITAGIALWAGLAVAAAVATLFARPIGRLAAVVVAVGRGDLSNLPPTRRAWLPREIDVLLLAMHDMVIQLRDRTRQLEDQALRDALTGLPNRVLLRDRLRHALEAGRLTSTPLALMIIDLDRFKEVNDALGHHQGDFVLQEVAARFPAVLRDVDTVARLGGDEFAVVLPGADHASATLTAGKLHRALEEPLTVAGQLVDLDASIGIALFPEHGYDSDTLMRHADVAMYAAKSHGSDHACYIAGQDTNRRARLALGGELRHAIHHHELRLEYQPILSLATGRVIGLEALARWPHPERGLIPPAEFIPLAEKTGLIKALSAWVLNAAVAQAGAWQEQGITRPVAVNLSVRNLADSELSESIARLLAKWDVPAELLRIEVTESSLMKDPDRALALLSRLRALGIHSAIDDFGTGFSSLGYLSRLAVRAIKIDQSFVTDIAVQPRNVTIVRSTIELAHNLGLVVIAEGIEDRPTWDLLTTLGCDYGQGYYMSRPLAAPDLVHWLTTAASEFHLEQSVSTSRAA